MHINNVKYTNLSTKLKIYNEYNYGSSYYFFTKTLIFIINTVVKPTNVIAKLKNNPSKPSYYLPLLVFHYIPPLLFYEKNGTLWIILYTTPAKHTINIIIDPINHNLGFKNNGLAIINKIAPKHNAPTNTPITVNASVADAL